MGEFSASFSLLARDRAVSFGMSAAMQDLKGELDSRRKLYILAGGALDFRQDVVVVPDPDFDMDKTIFSVMDAQVKEMVGSRFAKKFFWSDAAIARVAREFERVPRPLPERQELLDFMRDECDFKLEHADGSFMDHLTFCRDYCVAHYKSKSPTPLFIHSIMGVGTNVFPMEAAKIPQLQQLISPDEFAHVEAFPSLLRIVNNYALIDAMRASKDRLPKLRALSYHRLLDNKRVEITAEQLWVHLNFHVIHMLDFLPAAGWVDNKGDLASVANLLAFLREMGKLEAEVDLHLPGDGGVTLGELLDSSSMWVGESRQIHGMMTAERSAKIGHSLDFELQWVSNI